jgi:hypothetical protein
MYNLGKTINETSIDVAKSNEGSGISWLLGYWPFFYSTDFTLVHNQAFQGHQHFQVFCGCLMKLALLWLNL